ncbi:hypothetical protein KBY88_07625 [Cyanobium sp. Morenito 9A2]|nr:hypothetical protein [Cyanobium sp. Morenito 9A2]
MIHNRLRLILSLSLLTLSTFSSLPSYSQQQRYALTCLGTNTGTKIKFQYRWGDSGAWNEDTADPGRWTKMLWEYETPGQNKSPTLTVKYDDDYTSSTHIVTTPLKSYAARDLNCERSGKTYNYYLKSSELVIRSED